MTSIDLSACIPKEDSQFSSSLDEMADDTMNSAEMSPSDVLSHALDIIEISCDGANEKQQKSTASGRPRRSSPSLTAGRASPIHAANGTSSFPSKVVAHHHASMSKSTSQISQISNIGTQPPPNPTRPKLVRLNSTDSCSTATTASISAGSLVSSSSSVISSTVSSPSNSPISSPKRRIFQSYWERNRTPRGASRQIGKRLAMMSFPDVPQGASPSEEEDSQQDQKQDQNEPSTFDGAATATTISTTIDQPSKIGRASCRER